MAIIEGIEEAAIVTYVESRHRSFKDARADKETAWTNCINMYLGKFSPEVEAWMKKNSRSRRFVNASWDAIETVYAQIMMMLFPGDEWLGISPAKKGGFEYDDNAAEGLTALIHTQHKHNKFKQEIGSLVKQLLICGSGPFTTGWNIEWTVDYPNYAESMALYNQQNTAAWQQYQMQMQEYQAIVQAAVSRGEDPSTITPAPPFRQPGPPSASTTKAYEGPSLEIDDLFNFVIDPFPNRKDGALRIKATRKTLEFLKKFGVKDDSGYSVYDNLDKIGEVDLTTSKYISESMLVERMSAFGLNVPVVAVFFQDADNPGLGPFQDIYDLSAVAHASLT